MVALVASSTAASESSDAGTVNGSEEELPEAEVHDVEHGEGYVAVFPEDDEPPPEEGADVLPTGPVDEDELLIVAQEDGSLPLGLEPEELVEAQEILEEEGAEGVDELEAMRLLEERGFDVELPAEDSITTRDVECNPFIAGLATWSNAHTSSLAVFGNPGYEQFYQFSPSFEFTQQLVAGEGVGYTQTTSGYVRSWHGLGSAYTGSTAGGTVRWGNSAAYPQFRAQTVSLGASGSWCH